MKKHSLLTSLLFLSLLLNTGCVEKTSLNWNPLSTDETYESQTQNDTDNQEEYYSTVTPLPALPEIAGDYQQLQSIQGQKVLMEEHPTGFTFPQFPGKIMLLQVFGKECPYCFEEMPIINTLHQKYAQQLQVIAIQAQDPMSPSTAKELINKYEMNYPIIERYEASNLLLFLGETYNWTGILPYTLLIKDGVTEYSFPGKTSQEEIQEAIESLL